MSEKDRSQETTAPQRGLMPNRRKLSMFGRSIALPASRTLRLSLGALLCLGGVLAFLPILGLWMLPLGIAILSVDIPVIRRHSSRGAVQLRRRYPKLAKRMFPREPDRR